MPSSAHIFEPILFFLCQKEKNGFNLPRKERGQGAYRCPEFDSENLSHHPSVASVPTFRKVSALCASPFGGAAQQDQHLRADEYPQGAGRICNAPSSRTAALGIGPYTVRWKLAGTGGQGRPPLQGRTGTAQNGTAGTACPTNRRGAARTAKFRNFFFPLSASAGLQRLYSDDTGRPPVLYEQLF